MLENWKFIKYKESYSEITTSQKCCLFCLNDPPPHQLAQSIILLLPNCLNSSPVFIASQMEVHRMGEISIWGSNPKYSFGNLTLSSPLILI